MMPKMPNMPSVNNGSSSPLVDGLDSSDPSSLDAPLHEDKPIIETGDRSDSNKSILSVPSAPKKGIEVVALRDGFYNQMRKAQGSKFTIRDESEFGEWFRCVEPSFEKKRVNFYKEKKAKK